MRDLKELIVFEDLDKAHINYHDIAPFITRFKRNIEQSNSTSGLTISHREVGYSFEKRPINLFTIGSGETVIFAWSQMHGDEATATASLIDLIGLIEQDSALCPTHLFDSVTLHILPMLNPDGAEAITRENAQAIDINRDAQALQSPEGQLLMRLIDELSPDIALNLHDQSPYYQAGKSGNEATLAFLAPAFDESKSINKSRSYAMQIIGQLVSELESIIPDKIAKYDDTFASRCFGDQISGLGISTILIESGAHKGDPNRQIARALNTLCVLHVLQIIKDKRAANENTDSHIARYHQLPFNKENKMCWLKLKSLSFANASYKADVSITQTSRTSGIFNIKAVGDLSGIEGLNSFEGSAYHYRAGTPYLLRKKLSLTQGEYEQLLTLGYSHFVGDPTLIHNTSKYPILSNPKYFHSDNALSLEQPAYGLLIKDNVIHYALLNGSLVDLRAVNPVITNEPVD